MADNTPICIIGFDGATWKFIKPMAEGGLLPNFARLMEKGLSGNLQSTVPPISPQAWSTFLTGCNAGKHGIYEFIGHKERSYDLKFLNGGMRPLPTFFRLASESGVRTGTLNVPMTYPAEPLSAFCVSGFDAPSIQDGYSHPADLGHDLASSIPGFGPRGHPYNATPESYLPELLNLVDRTLDAWMILHERFKPELSAVCFDSTDLVQHFYWHYYQPDVFGIEAEDSVLATAIEQVYARCDKALGAMLDHLSPEATVILMSDHGACPAEKVVFLDRWLEQEGLLQYASGHVGGRQIALRGMRAAHQMLQKRLPSKVKRILFKLLPDARERMRTVLTFGQIDWSRTQAFSLGIDSTFIFINSKDRFPEGIISSAAECEKVKDSIIEKLGKLNDPDTGEGIVEKVYRREELYNGPESASSPDLIVVWKDNKYTTRRGYGREKELFASSLDASDVSAYSSLSKSGTHDEKGIFLACGPDIARGGSIEGVTLQDIAPTILARIGLAVPSYMDGRVVQPICGAGKISITEFAASKSSQHDYSAKDNELIETRLKGLGYIDS